MREDIAEVAAERADVWTLDVIEVQPAFIVNNLEGKIPFANYLHDCSVPIKLTDGSDK